MEEEEIWSGGGVKDGYSRPALLLPALLPAPLPSSPHPSTSRLKAQHSRPDNYRDGGAGGKEGGGRVGEDRKELEGKVKRREDGALQDSCWRIMEKAAVAAERQNQSARYASTLG